MGYRHTDIVIKQTPKRPGAPCGDVVRVDRSETATVLVCGDGIGSGVKANIAATLCVSRLAGLVKEGCSLREAFKAVVKTMNEAREPGLPFTAFTIARFLHTGETTLLSYEAPAPVMVNYHSATPIRQRVYQIDGAEVAEANCFIETGEGIIIVSDGITQAGLGAGLPLGWGTDGLCRFTRDEILNRTPLRVLPEVIHDEARQYWGRLPGDDCTVCAAICRQGREVTILSGPPLRKQDDHSAAREFMQLPGAKVVCGATTATIVASYLKVPLDVSTDSLDTIAPPYYTIEGVDLVTEGAVTLNQVYNILEEDAHDLEPNSGVAKLCALLQQADRVTFLVGRARNDANSHIIFRQQGILPRTTIVPLLAKKLEKEGKLVVVRWA